MVNGQLSISLTWTQTISRLVFLNLIPEELVNTLKRLFVRRGDGHSATAVGGFVLVFDLVFQALQSFNARGLFAVNQHGDVEITVFEHLRNVTQVRLNGATI